MDILRRKIVHEITQVPSPKTDVKQVVSVIISLELRVPGVQRTEVPVGKYSIGNTCPEGPQYTTCRKYRDVTQDM